MNARVLYQSYSSWFLLAFKRSLYDRGMLITDFFLATSVPFIVLYLLWTNIYDNQESIADFTYIETMFYYAYAIAIGRLCNGYDVIQELSEQIINGRLEPYLVFPRSLPVQRLLELLGGGGLYYVPILAIILIQGYIVGWDDGLVDNILFYFGLIFLLLLAQVLCFAVSFAIGLLSFWLYEDDALLLVLTMSSAFLGGLYLPPSFWPEILQPIMLYNPFRFMIAAPAEFLVTRDFELLFQSIIFCFLYSGIMILIFKIIWRKGSSNYSSSGG